MREGEVILCVWEDPGVTYSVKTRGVEGEREDLSQESL